MKTKVITTIMITLFLASMLTMTFNVTSVKASPVLTASVDIDPEVLFVDDFEDAVKTGMQWQPVAGSWAGTWAVESGKYSALCPSVYPGYAVSYMKDLLVCDFVLEFKTMILQTFTNGSDFTGVFFRTSSMQDVFGYAGAGPGYGYLAIIRANREVDLYRSDGLTNTFIQGKISAIDPTADYVTFRVEAVGNHIKVYVNGQKFIDTYESTYPSGFMALHPGRTHSHFDDVCVIEAAPSTLNLNSKGKWITAFIEPDPVLLKEDFESYSLGSDGSPTWTPVSGTWAVETDPTAPSGEQAYSQNDKTTALGPQRSLAGDYDWTDYVVEVKAKGIEGYLSGYGTHTWVGLVFRAKDPTHFYEYYFRTTIPDIIVVKHDGATRTVVSGPVSFSCANNVWYTLKVVAKGNSFRFFVDDAEITGLAFTDTDSPFTSGKVGVLVFYGSHAHFDDVLVTTSAEYIDLTTVLLGATVPAVTDPKYDFVSDPNVYLTDIDKDGILERLVKFDRSQVIAYINALGLTLPSPLLLTITGKISGIPFEGSDTIRVISQGKP